jgi:hypothetical protein
MIDAELFKGLGILLGGMGTGAICVQKWPIWKKNGNGNGGHDAGCQDQGCHNLVITTAAKVETIEVGQAEMFKEIRDMPLKIVTLLKDAKGLL